MDPWGVGALWGREREGGREGGGGGGCFLWTLTGLAGAGDSHLHVPFQTRRAVTTGVTVDGALTDDQRTSVRAGLVQ